MEEKGRRRGREGEKKGGDGKKGRKRGEEEK